MTKRRVYIFGVIVAVAIVLGTVLWQQQRKSLRAADDVFDPGGCTTAVIAGSATASGRPLLWKNRDRSIEDQEIVYFNDGPFDYITITNTNDSTQAWGGVNRAGFAIEDANNWNTPDTIVGEDDDGWIIKLALQTCRTVDEFQEILDSANVEGYTAPAIYGVIDTAGGAAMFETYTHSYIRYDAEDAPLGILVRSNWSYAGSMGGRIGVYRHDRAKSLIESASQAGNLDVEYLATNVMRDLLISNTFNPYPLPYEGTQGGLPQGRISTSGAICRRLTGSALVIEGILPGEHPMLSTMWAFPSPVQVGVMLPFWLAPRATPAAVNGPLTAPLCNAGLRLKHFAQHAPLFVDTIDTYVLNDGNGGGVHLTTFPLEQYVFMRADSALTVWRAANAPDSAGMIALCTQLCDTVTERLAAWPRPGETMIAPSAVQGLTIDYTAANGILLHWFPVTTNTAELPITPASYSVWYSTNASLPDNSWTLLDHTSTTDYTISTLDGQAKKFYLVRAEL